MSWRRGRRVRGEGGWQGWNAELMGNEFEWRNVVVGSLGSIEG